MNPDEVKHRELEQLAHRFWEERGSPLGSPEQDWLRAEEELRRQPASRVPLSSVIASPAEE
jgi:hypothetical protein